MLVENFFLKKNLQYWSEHGVDIVCSPLFLIPSSVLLHQPCLEAVVSSLSQQYNYYVTCIQSLQYQLRNTSIIVSIILPTKYQQYISPHRQLTISQCVLHRVLHRVFPRVTTQRLPCHTPPCHSVVSHIFSKKFSKKSFRHRVDTLYTVPHVRGRICSQTLHHQALKNFMLVEKIF